ncbi:right-handed parallel beta-helix repeat-containing protein [Granulicella arctica]|uniref:right-handed parallel beta-helix repeat-containing protein n=1 Tax=Granulicella arctica TaxID=940613 RepID=UPI0021E0F514|nr:right-handed parallel beta-helix repeat-containing protein [Granulicella arctica]
MFHIYRGSQYILAMLLTFLSVCPLVATTYYVDSMAGLDSNPGTSQGAPWQTIAKVNGVSLNPGDSVLLATGSVWHEQLTVTRSGSTSAPITFGAYGSKQQPILDGADQVSGWNLVSGNTYCAVFHGTAYKAYTDATYQQTGAVNRVASLDAVQATPGSLYSDGDYVYLHLSDESSPNDHTIEVSGARLYNILATSQNHLVFSGLELIRAARSGFLGNSTVDNSSGTFTNEYISLTGMTVFNWGNSFMDVGPDGGFAGIYGYGLSMSTQSPQRGWSVTKSYCGIGDVAPVLTYHVSCIDIEGTIAALIDHNTIASINSLGISASAYYNGDPCSSPTISNNDISMSQGNIRVAGCPNAIVSHNTIHDSNGYGINLDGDEDANHPEYSTNAHLLTNTITNLAPSHDGTLYNGIDCNKGSSGGTADGNIIRQVSGNSLTLEGDTFVPNTSGQPCSGWTLSNNTLDASQNLTVTGGAPGRTGPVYIRDIAIQGLKLKNNTYILNTNYANGMTYGFTNAGDLSHDLTLAAFNAVAPNGGGGASH